MIAVYRLSIAGYLALGLLLAGCTTSAPRSEPAAAGSAPVAASAPETGRVAPPDVAAALLPPMSAGLPRSNANAEAHFDVKVRNASARDFFIGLVEGTSYNVIVHPEVTGSINLDLKNVTVPEVMTVVRDAFGYDFEVTGKTYQIFPNTVRTRLFHIDYLSMKRIGKSDVTTVASGVSETTSSGGSDGSTTRSSAVSSQVTTESEADFWTQLRSSVQALVGTGEGRLVSINPQVGLLMVKARPDELRDVQRFLSATQAAAQRQVVLEARILEVELAEGFRSGINWSALPGAINGTRLIPGQFGSGTLVEGDAGNLSELSNGLPGTNALSPAADPDTVASIVRSPFGGVFAMSITSDNFAGFIELLKTQGDVHVLSSPRVSAINNQKAVIKVGSDEFFVTNIESNTTTTAAAAGTTSIGVELSPFFSGVILDVIPQIAADGSVTLHVHPSISQVSQQNKVVDTSLGTLRLPLAASTVRESDTVIRAHDGQIVVIGGLMQTRKTKNQAKIPLLGDLPFLGSLFKQTSEVERKTELVILLKPTIVESAADWNRQLDRSSPRLNEMRGEF